MGVDLYTDLQTLPLLRDARECPEDDTPRLVLADWLEEHGDPARAEFIRTECRLAPGGGLGPAARAEGRERCRLLLDRHGGAWLGPLWRFWPASLGWHRGLLSLRLPKGLRPEGIREVLPWVDTALFVLQGKQGLLGAAEWLRAGELNHVYLDLRRPLSEANLLEALGRAPESRCLRTLSIDRPLGLMAWWEAGEEGPRVVPVASEAFLARLVRGCPLGRHLTHLGSSAPFSASQARLLRGLGVEPVDAQDRLWMHSLPPASFSPRRAVAATGPGRNR